MKRYLYTATSITLAIFYMALVVTTTALLQLLLGIATDLQTRQALASGLGITVVAGPLWWLHWRGLRWQSANTDRQGPGNPYHTYLWTVVGFAILIIFITAGASVTTFAQLALGILPDSHAGWAQGLPFLTAMVTATLLWWPHWQAVTTGALLTGARAAPKSTARAPAAHRVGG